MNTTKSMMVLGLVLGLAFVNCGGDSQESSAPANESAVAESNLDPDLQAGKEMYEMSCASCHGEKGAGDGAAAKALNPPPRNYKAPASEWRNGPTVAGVTKTLKLGIKGTSMVAYNHLGDETIDQLAKYVVYLHEN